MFLLINTLYHMSSGTRAQGWVHESTQIKWCYWFLHYQSLDTSFYLSGTYLLCKLRGLDAKKSATFYFSHIFMVTVFPLATFLIEHSDYWGIVQWILQPFALKCMDSVIPVSKTFMLHLPHLPSQIVVVSFKRHSCIFYHIFNVRNTKHAVIYFKI